MTEDVKVEGQEVATENETQPTLGVGDLVAMVQVIDIVSERGAFKGPELESVGVLRGRLARFVDANNKAAKEQEEAQQAQPE